MGKKDKYKVFMEFYDGRKEECDNIQDARTMEFYRIGSIKDGFEDVITDWCIECNGRFCDNKEKHCVIKNEKLLNAINKWKSECENVPRNL